MIGIRREDKSRWEGRVPLVPSDIRKLIQDHGLEFQVQKAPNRAFPEDQYKQAGAAVVDDLKAAPIIMGVKEIPVACFEPNKTYVFFSHTIKAQPANMPALRRIVELGCTLIDYERIVDGQNRRLVFFGRYAGLAGMIDTLWALGKRLDHEGFATPFSAIEPAHRYKNLEHFSEEIAKVAAEIRSGGLPKELCPFVCGFAGYGQVSQGAQHIYDQLPMKEVSPNELASLPADPRVCYKVVFREEHMVSRIDASRPFELQEYYKQPELYQTAFFRHVPHLTVMLTGIFWTPKYPRLISREQFQKLYAGKQPRLRVIGDVTCDIDGSIACTTHSTTPDSPIYVYEPATGETFEGVAGNGPVVLAVDFLPCELPVDASQYFSGTLSPFIPALARANFSGALETSGLPPELQRAVIVYKGRLTAPYRYLEPEIQ
jgi:alanine dehydrogenase